MIFIKKICDYFCYTIVISAILFVTGCTDTLLSPVPPSFQFTKEESQTGLVAFSVVCTGIHYAIGATIINVKTDQTHHFMFTCDLQEGYSQIKILKIPAGYYTFGKISYFDGYATHSTNEKNHFYFTIQAHKVNYIGRIYYTINGSKLITGVNSESVVDIPQIKMALPELSPNNYVVLFWGKDDFGDFIAKE